MRSLLKLHLPLVLLLPSFPAAGQDSFRTLAQTPIGPLKYKADLRVRYELDYDSQRANGTMRDDRHRARTRARIELNLTPDEGGWSIGTRLRTGNHRSQQSPHLTFLTDDGDTDSFDAVLDKYFVKYQPGSDVDSWVWAGRNSFPFWTPNELFWDDDVTPTGIAGRLETDLSTHGSLRTTVGAFLLPDGGWGTHQPMIGGQVKWVSPPLCDDCELKVEVAPGFFYMFEEQDDPENLLDGNGQREYAIAALNAAASAKFRERTVSVGADIYKNFSNYSVGPGDPFVTSRNRDEDFGYVLYASADLDPDGKFNLGYFYSHIETFAVNASYAQDDWVRFGNGPQTRSSDFKGHELRATIKVCDNLKIRARWYLVEAITSGQDGNRFRLDFDFSF